MRVNGLWNVTGNELAALILKCINVYLSLRQQGRDGPRWCRQLNRIYWTHRELWPLNHCISTPCLQGLSKRYLFYLFFASHHLNKTSYDITFRSSLSNHHPTDLPLHLDPPSQSNSPNKEQLAFLSLKYNIILHMTPWGISSMAACEQSARKKKKKKKEFEPVFFLFFSSPHERNSKAFPNLVDCPSRKRNYSPYQAARTTPAIKWLIKPHCCYHSGIIVKLFYHAGGQTPTHFFVCRSLLRTAGWCHHTTLQPFVNLLPDKNTIIYLILLP